MLETIEEPDEIEWLGVRFLKASSWKELRRALVRRRANGKKKK